MKKDYECPTLELLRLGDDIITQSNELDGDYDDKAPWKDTWFAKIG